MPGRFAPRGVRIFHFSLFIFNLMRDLFLKDLGWKIFSLLLAAAHLADGPPDSAGVPEPETTGGASSLTYGNLPVLIVAAASDVHLYRVAPSAVSVTVRGSPDAIAVLQANQIRATVDLTDIESGRRFETARGRFGAVRHYAGQRRAGQSRHHCPAITVKISHDSSHKNLRHRRRPRHGESRTRHGGNRIETRPRRRARLQKSGTPVARTRQT